MNEPTARTALVLSGGGAYGAFAVGVMKTLFAGRSPATNYTAVVPDIFTGTSVGAFNAALMVTQPESCLDAVSRLEEIWLTRAAKRPGACGNGVLRIRGNPADLLDAGCLSNPARLASRFAGDAVALGLYAVSRTANFLASPNDPFEDRVVALIDLGSFVDPSPYHELLRDVISEEQVRNSARVLKITATDWIGGTVRYFCNADFHDDLGILSIMASTAIPGLFPPVSIDGRIYVDGGVVENTPLNSAIEAGATNLHVVYLDPKPSVIRINAEANTVDTGLRVYYIMLATKINEDIETARWINAGLDALRNYQQDQTISGTSPTDLLRVVGKLLQTNRPYKRLTIHRYFPEEALGGSLGMLDFDVNRIAAMIEQGERTALVHDCQQNGCVL